MGFRDLSHTSWITETRKEKETVSPGLWIIGADEREAAYIGVMCVKRVKPCWKTSLRDSPYSLSLSLGQTGDVTIYNQTTTLCSKVCGKRFRRCIYTYIYMFPGFATNSPRSNPSRNSLVHSPLTHVHPQPYICGLSLSPSLRQTQIVDKTPGEHFWNYTIFIRLYFNSVKERAWKGNVKKKLQVKLIRVCFL